MITDWIKRTIQQGRRERNTIAGRCINDNNAGTHGAATHGVRCQRCALVHRHGAELARSKPEWQ